MTYTSDVNLYEMPKRLPERPKNPIKRFAGFILRRKYAPDGRAILCSCGHSAIYPPYTFVSGIYNCSNPRCWSSIEVAHDSIMEFTEENGLTPPSKVEECAHNHFENTTFMNDFAGVVFNNKSAKQEK